MTESANGDGQRKNGADDDDSHEQDSEEQPGNHAAGVEAADGGVRLREPVDPGIRG